MTETDKVQFQNKAALIDYINNYWLDLGDVSNISVENELLHRSQADLKNTSLFLVKYFKDPNHFDFVCRHVFNVHLAPFQLAILRELWVRPFPMLIATRGGSKSFLLAVYVLLRLLLTSEARMVITGAGFRQAKIVFEYCESIWRGAPILRSLFNYSKEQGPTRAIDRHVFTLGLSRAIFIPIGTGEKIRGLRSNFTITDEFASVNPEIYENVIAPFGAVTSAPVANVKEMAKEKAMRNLGLLEDEEKLYQPPKNQMVIAGTGAYYFNHFYRYYDKYKKIVNSMGDKKQLDEIFGGKVPDSFSWEDYSVIRLPYNLLPPGFMDENQIARSRAVVSKSNFALEYLASFSKDSDGFFKRSLIESCVVSDNMNPLDFPEGVTKFGCSLKGSKDKKYVIGVDPASEQDNFAIVVLEVWPNHCRVVYVWTTIRKKFMKKLRVGQTHEHDFYKYCARKIRDLMIAFPNVVTIGIDSQGGVPIAEALHDPDNLLEGEVPIWDIIDYDKPKDTDAFSGLHILNRVNFASAEWVGEANHGLKKDMEDKRILFPFFDNLSLELAMDQDMKASESGDETRIYDTLEECVFEIEELKNELTSIVMTLTGVSGRERWDTPEVKLEGSKKGRLRKDRYSALIIANMQARVINIVLPVPVHKAVGGFAQASHGNVSPKDALYVGPERYVSGLTASTVAGIRH